MVGVEFDFRNEKLKKQLEEWQSKKDEEDRKQQEQEKLLEQQRQEEEKAKVQHYEELKNKIAEYKQDLRKKNNETLQILKTARSEKKLGPLAPLKNPSVLEKIDLGNEYHLPQIVRTVEMMEEEKQVCQRYLHKHASKRGFKISPRSRRLTKRSPVTHRSGTLNEGKGEYSRTQPQFLSPQTSKKDTEKIYKVKNMLLLLKQADKRPKHQYRPKQSVIQQYVTHRAGDINKFKENTFQASYSKDDKVADNFVDYNKSKVASESSPLV